MEYRIEITKMEPNPNYAEEMREYRMHGEPPKEYLFKTYLSAALTEAEFKAVRDEVMKKF